MRKAAPIKPKPPKRAVGRPQKPIDWEQVDKLCAIQCTGEEIASFIGVNYDTLNNRCGEEKGVAFSEYFEQKRGMGKIALRRRQYQKAVGGNTTMLIWLGKQYLGQKDQHGLTLNDMPSPYDEFTKASRGDAPGWDVATKPDPKPEEEPDA